MILYFWRLWKFLEMCFVALYQFLFVSKYFTFCSEVVTNNYSVNNFHHNIHEEIDASMGEFKYLDIVCLCENLNISCPCEYCLAGGWRKFVFPVTSLSWGGGGGQLWRIVGEKTNTNSKKGSFRSWLFSCKQIQLLDNFWESLSPSKKKSIVKWWYYASELCCSDISAHMGQFP